MIKDLYKNKEAKKWRENHGSLECDQDLGERVYTSRLIGSNPDLVMHGGLGKQELKKLHDAKMINIIGEEIVSYRSKKYSDNEFFFDYGKKEIKANRKMGHLTTLIK